jgi:hypothetical protein
LLINIECERIAIRLLGALLGAKIQGLSGEDDTDNQAEESEDRTEDFDDEDPDKAVGVLVRTAVP